MEPSPVGFSEELSPALREVLKQEFANVTAITRRAVSHIEASVSDYSLSSDPHMLQDLYSSALSNAQLWFELLLHGGTLSAQVLEPTVSFAPKRVHQGISLPGLLKAFRIIARSFWAGMLEAVENNPALHTELLYKISPYLLQHFDTVADAVARSYLEEQAQHARWRDRLRRELFTVLVNRPDDKAAFDSYTTALGFNPKVAHCALVIRFDADTHSRLESVIDAPLSKLAHKLGMSAGNMMHVVHRDHLVIWVEVPAGRSTIAFDSQLAQIAETLLERTRAISAVGVGLPGTSAVGWRVSMDQCFRALSAPITGAKASVYRYSRILLDEALTVSENVSVFMSAMIETLAADPSLLETVQSYIQNKQHRKATAAALNVHPNTLDHRLEKIEALLDGQFDDIDWLARVHAGLRLFRPQAV